MKGAPGRSFSHLPRRLPSLPQEPGWWPWIFADWFGGELFDGLKRRLPSEQVQALSADEGKWLRETRGPCGQNDDCLYKAYRERITYLNSLPK